MENILFPKAADKERGPVWAYWVHTQADSPHQVFSNPETKLALVTL